MSLYLGHFGLREAPFRITPHTDFFFDGADRGATLDALMYAILHDEGIVKVSGEVGSGKTMLCRVLMERLPEHVATIYLATPSLARNEILHAIADDLDLQLSGERTTVALRELQEELIRLYAAGRRVVILIDEAHAMPEDTLEQVRLLSNLESNRHKLLQIVLFGQPELDATLAKPALRQLRDRITNTFRMRPLPSAEVARYLSFRMRAAGYHGPEVFSPAAVRKLARASGGLTRRINILADKSLLAAFTDNAHAVSDKFVRAAVADAEFAAAAPPRAGFRPWYAAAALAAGIAIGVAFALQVRDPVVVAPKVVAAPQPPAPEPVVVKQVEAAKLLSDGQAGRLAKYSPGGQPLLKERIASTQERLERVPDERYAIELFVTENTDPARMERFLIRTRDVLPLEEVLVIPLMKGREQRLRVAFGDFASREEALEARRRLPQRYLSVFSTSLRSFAELRGQI